MTNREAAEYLDKYVMNVAPYGKWKEVVERAISALQAQADGDCISRQAAIEAVIYAKDDLDAERTIRRLPSAQPERKKGKWIDDNCSECGFYVYHGDMRNFCPKCGAKMKGGGNG